MSLVRNNKFNRLGVTFIEILIAIFVVAVGVIPVLSLFLKGTRTVESGGVIFQVAIAAQNIMDRVRSDAFIWQQTMPVNVVIPSNDDKGLYLPEDLIKHYKARAELKIDVAKGHTIIETGEPEENLYQIDVKITWVENGVNKNFSLMNYRANINSQTMKTSTRFN